MQAPPPTPLPEPRRSEQPTAHDALPADTSCKRCGYSLAGLTLSSVCPECGLAAIASRKVDLPLPIEDGIVSPGTQCGCCGANIAGAHISHFCPGCGISVGAAAQCSRLATSNLAWLEAISRGWDLVVFGSVLQLAVFAPFFARCFFGFRSRDTMQSVVTLALLCLGVLGWLLVRQGMRLLTTPDPSIPTQSDATKAARTARACFRWTFWIVPLVCSLTFALTIEDFSYDRFGNGTLNLVMFSLTAAMLGGTFLSTVCEYVIAGTAWDRVVSMMLHRAPFDVQFAIATRKGLNRSSSNRIEVQSGMRLFGIGAFSLRTAYTMSDACTRARLARRKFRVPDALSEISTKE